MVVDSLHVYPLKSIAGQRLSNAEVTPRGFAHDRRFLLVDLEHRFLTGRQHPDLVLARATVLNDGWRFDAPGCEPLHVTPPDDDVDAITVTIWNDEVPARPVGARADAWFSDYLGQPCQLVYQHDQDLRPVRPARATRDSDVVSFADGYPVLLIGTASLADLNARLAMPVSMGRFRTNIVADTHEAFVEDRWRRIRIGDVEFDVVKRCARCVFTTIDPLSGARDPNNEPLATLRGYRLDKGERGVMFGVNLIPRSVGHIACGLPIDVIESD